MGKLRDSLKVLLSLPFWIIEGLLGYVEWNILNLAFVKLTLLLLLAGLAIPIIMFLIFWFIIGIYGA